MDRMVERYCAAEDCFMLAPEKLVIAADRAIEAWRRSAGVPLTKISHSMGDPALLAKAMAADEACRAAYVRKD